MTITTQLDALPPPPAPELVKTRPLCFAYQYTLQAPGTLGAIGGALTINVGERYRLPLKLGN